MYVGIIMQHKPIECYTIGFTNLITYFIYTDEVIIRSRDYRNGRDDSYELSGVPYLRQRLCFPALFQRCCIVLAGGLHLEIELYCMFCACKHRWLIGSTYFISSHSIRLLYLVLSHHYRTQGPSSIDVLRLTLLASPIITWMYGVSGSDEQQHVLEE